MAINRADPRNRRLLVEKSLEEEPCVFISHKSEDMEEALKIGDYILNMLGSIFIT